MSIANLISNVILAISICLVVYVIADLFIKKSKLKNNKIKSVNNKRYIIIITFLIVMFVVHGVLRNFM